jgi:hypothetical protein
VVRADVEGFDEGGVDRFAVQEHGGVKTFGHVAVDVVGLLF